MTIHVAAQVHWLLELKFYKLHTDNLLLDLILQLCTNLWGVICIKIAYQFSM